MNPRLPGLTVISTAPVIKDALESLRRHFSSVEVIELDLPRRDPIEKHAGEINRAIDAAHAWWILVLRDREVVTESLAGEIAAVCVEASRAWAFRLRRVVLYTGHEIALEGQDPGAIRLLHRRHCRFDPKGEREMRLQGTVIRLRETLRVKSFETREEHLEHLRSKAVPHSFARRLLRFLATVSSSRGWRSGLAGISYLWIEAGFDQGPPGEAFRSPSSATPRETGTDRRES